MNFRTHRAAPGLILVWSGEAPTFEVIEPDAGKWSLGREHPAWRTRDARMSRRHCELEFAEGKWHIRDLGSANGVRLDGCPLSSEVERECWRMIQVGRSLLLPCRLPAGLPAIAHDRAVPFDWKALEVLAAETAPESLSAELPWWIHHTVRAVSPLSVDVSFISTCLLCAWRGIPELLDCVRSAVEQAGSSPRLVAEHLGVLHVVGERRSVFRMDHPLVGTLALPRVLGPAQMNRLRDPAVFVAALRECEGNHQRAATYLKLTPEGFEQWLLRHGLANR